MQQQLLRRKLADSEPPMGEWLRQAVTTPLPGIGAIWDLPPNQLWVEMEFGLQEGESIFRGAMDLVVRTPNGWYLIDWKTNQVQGDLHTLMQQGDYLEQARLYSRALQRWLSRVAPSEQLKGVLYVFVRTMEVYSYGI
jgi:ATP-dependent exoDNAse (exonuclease V) beta subunit